MIPTETMRRHHHECAAADYVGKNFYSIYKIEDGCVDRRRKRAGAIPTSLNLRTLPARVDGFKHDQ